MLWAGQVGQDSEDSPVELFEWEEHVMSDMTKC